jgi:propane monooxygenase reductase subunit
MSVPYGVFTLREKSEGDLIFVGGGSGMAPILSILRHMAETGIERNATFYYGARTKKDLFYLDEIQELGEQLPGEFKFVPALSEPEDDDEWDGETGLVTDVINDLEDDLSEMEAYMAGPPPMIDAALPVLMGKGVEGGKIYYDKFTESGAVEGGGEKEQSGPEQAEEASR